MAKREKHGARCPAGDPDQNGDREVWPCECGLVERRATKFDSMPGGCVAGGVRRLRGVVTMDPKELRRLLSEATDGPWGTSAEHGHWQIGPDAGGGWAKSTLEIDARSNDNAHNDAELVAAMRNALPDLLDVVEAVREWGREYTEDHRNTHGGPDTRAMDAVREIGIRLALADRIAKGGG